MTPLQCSEVKAQQCSNCGVNGREHAQCVQHEVTYRCASCSQDHHFLEYRCHCGRLQFGAQTCVHSDGDGSHPQHVTASYVDRWNIGTTSWVDTDDISVDLPPYIATRGNGKWEFTNDHLTWVSISTLPVRDALYLGAIFHRFSTVRHPPAEDDANEPMFQAMSRIFRRAGALSSRTLLQHTYAEILHDVDEIIGKVLKQAWAFRDYRWMYSDQTGPL